MYVIRVCPSFMLYAYMSCGVVGRCRCLVQRHGNVVIDVERILTALGVVLERSWLRLGWSWELVGNILGCPRAVLVAAWGVPWRSLGRS